MRGTTVDSMRLRARDSDRQVVCGVLDDAFGNGQLSETEHRARLESAAQARTLGDLRTLVTDLQVPSELEPSMPTTNGDGKRRWRVGAAVVAVLVIVGVVVARVADGDESGSASPRTSENLLTVAGLTRLLDDVQQRFGDLQADEVTVYPDYARVARQDPEAPAQSRSYWYEDRTFDDPAPSNRFYEGIPMDLAPLRPSLPRLIGLVNGADQTLAVPDPTSVHLQIEPQENGAAVAIYLWNEKTGQSGTLTTTLNGEILEIHRADR
ncbi:DUF1707 SHOCT-like domain-containing protein [Rhodococcus sp. SGAir0479]|uniref:DUF1707 SHOCT-like domain-containing protein n=1 Tax=Rhodococcus sp. SGAir0479 TaxID=2567884 RepID=UPI0010CD084D|nr:DUF1707 domain-containing protein [Rhodococcus sp. SGAir0479]QCQ92976.1 DUF1707 domain-containing protein [Rhodococcus sp. SGAir0479]